MADWHEVSAQDPHALPVHDNTPLDDDEFERYVNDGSPYADQVLAALSNVEGDSVVVSILLVGQDNDSAGISQGLYFLGARVETAWLRTRFQAMGRFRSDATQLTLSAQISPPTSDEFRRGVVGWSFREV